VYRLAQAVVSLRYGGSHQWSPQLIADETPIDEAILALYRSADRPTRFFTFLEQGPDGETRHAFSYSDMGQELKRRVAAMPPEVSRILGRLILDVLEAQRGVEVAFRNVSAEHRYAVFRLTDIPELAYLFSTGGLTYRDLYALDDVAREVDEGALWFAGLQCVEALDQARRSLQALPRATLDKSPSFDALWLDSRTRWRA